MGLDISVNKLIERPENITENNYYFRLVDDDGNYKNNFPEWTKKFETKLVEQWYDWKKYQKETGIDIKKCKWISNICNEEGYFMVVWDLNFGKQPELEDFKIGFAEDGTQQYDIDEYYKQLGLHSIEINLDKVPVYDKEISVIFYEEIGYQYKGLNSKFYEDYENGKIGYFVWDKKELQRYKKEYCDKVHEYVFPNDKKSGEIVHPKFDFQRNIIDNFKEKECCVTFDW